MINILINTATNKKLYAFGKKQAINLALSENPLGCSPKVEDVIKLGNFNVGEYPDPNSRLLKESISIALEVNTNEIFVANGSEAIISAIPKIVQKGEVIIPSLTFPLFKIASSLSGMKVVISPVNTKLEIQIPNIKEKVNEDTKIIFICNPNNPTGKLLTKPEILELVQSSPCLVVVDEANIEFGGESIVQEVKNFDNLLVLRTFSKGFGLAGIRLGFCVANNKIIQLLEKVSQPFPVTNISLELARTALNDSEFIVQTKKFMEREREFLAQELTKRGFTVIPSQTNNLFVDISKFSKSSTEFVSKLNEQGVAVVDGASFGMNQFIRISPRLREINELFLQKIDILIST